MTYKTIHGFSFNPKRLSSLMMYCHERGYVNGEIDPAYMAMYNLLYFLLDDKNEVKLTARDQFHIHMKSLDGE